MRLACLVIALLSAAAGAQDERPRARDLGVPFDGTPGPLNAITDVPGVTVGHATIIEDFENGSAARTGVTAVLPRGEDSVTLPVFAGTAVLNGAGEMTGTIWVKASGFLEGPVMLTSTQSVGVVFEETIKWRVRKAPPDVTGYNWSDPVVAETWGGRLNDENGFHVRASTSPQQSSLRPLDASQREMSAAAPAWSVTSSSVVLAPHRELLKPPTEISQLRRSSRPTMAGATS